MTNTDKPLDKKPEITAKEATHIISKRAVGPRSYERKEGTFIITRNHRIKIAEKPEDIVTGDKPVIPAHLAADLVDAGVAEYFAAGSVKTESAKTQSDKPAENELPDTVIVTPIIDAASAVASKSKEPAKEG